MTAKAWGAICALAVVWGGAFFFTEVLEPHLGPYAIAHLRVAIAAAGLWLLGLASGRTPSFVWIRWRDYAIAGLITFAIPFTCFAWAQTQLTGGMTAVMNAMTPIMIVVVSHFYPGGERATWLKAAGVAVGFLGVALLVAPSAEAAATGPLAAKLVALIGPFFYGIAGNYSRRFAREDPTITVTGTMTCAALWTLPVALVLDGPPGAPPLEIAWALLGLGLLSTALAFRAFYAWLPIIGATNFSIVTFLVPIAAMALGAAFLNEAITVAQIGAMGVILIGLVLVDGRLPRRLFAQAPRSSAP